MEIFACIGQAKEEEEMNNKIAILFLCAGTLLAQDGPEKATVPLKDPSRPARIEARLMSGGITVRGADVKEVLVEAHSRGERGERERDRRSDRSDRSDGMKRLDLPGNAGLDVTEEDNVVT